MALAFEAAVAGGIPIIKALREGLAANHVARVYGILNGTCNYILTTMRETGRDFADVLAEAQRLGYAEADPSFDIDGIDAAHKLAILAAVAFGSDGRFRRRPCRGHPPCLRARHRVRRGARLPHQAAGPRAADRAWASSSACIPAWCRARRRSPMSRASSTPSWSRAISSAASCSRAAARAPSRPPRPSSPISSTSPTGAVAGLRGAGLGSCGSCRPRRWTRHRGAYYVRLMVVDRPGVIADVAAALARRAGLDGSDDPARPRAGRGGAGGADHARDGRGGDAPRARAASAGSTTVLEPPRMIRIENL